MPRRWRFGPAADRAKREAESFKHLNLGIFWPGAAVVALILRDDAGESAARIVVSLEVSRGIAPGEIAERVARLLRVKALEVAPRLVEPGPAQQLDVDATARVEAGHRAA